MKSARTTARGDDHRLIDLGKKLEAAWSHERHICRDTKAPEAVFEKAAAATSRIVGAIEKTPAQSLSGLQVKARAIAWCHSGKPNLSELLAGSKTHASVAGHTTDVWLARSILADVLKLAA